MIGSGKTGILIGVDYSLPLTESFSLRPQLEYILKGAKNDEENGLPDNNLNYLEFPLTLVYKIPIGNNHLGLLGGPYLALLVSASDVEDIASEDFYNSSELGYSLVA